MCPGPWGGIALLPPIELPAPVQPRLATHSCCTRASTDPPSTPLLQPSDPCLGGATTFPVAAASASVRGTAVLIVGWANELAAWRKRPFAIEVGRAEEEEGAIVAPLREKMPLSACVKGAHHSSEGNRGVYGCCGI